MSPSASTLRLKQIGIAVADGMDNVGLIFDAATRTSVPVATALALFEGETGGRNIYGHDVGGALSTHSRAVTVCGKTYPRGSDIPVTPANAGVFLLKIGAGAKSNGMGPGQVTYARDLPDGRSGGYFRMMLEANQRPWIPLENMIFCLTTFKKQLDAAHGDIAVAGGHYNGGGVPNMTYGRALKARETVWKTRLGIA